MYREKDLEELEFELIDAGLEELYLSLMKRMISLFKPFEDFSKMQKALEDLALNEKRKVRELLCPQRLFLKTGA
ncbi:hypothetical protein CS542_04795 [Pedobacter sp. IW39]|nr:hypothetical protein CS542_04795 [Pedobacter sp. IW39]